jgi:hypothetical protein
MDSTSKMLLTNEPEIFVEISEGIVWVNCASLSHVVEIAIF